MSDIKLLDLYTQILEDVGLTVTEDGEVLDGKSKPLKITFEGSKRPLVLPTESQLKRDDAYAVLYFHPACESLYRGRSEVLNALAIMMAGRIHLSAVLVTTAVMEFGADKDKHKKAPQRKAEILFKLPSISKPTLAAWKAMMASLTLPGEQGKRPLLRLTMDRSVELDNGDKLKRGCTVNFPILDAEDLYTPDLTKIANDAIGNALHVTLGAASYFSGSNANVAPYFDALCRCYHSVMSHIYDIAERVSEYLVGAREIPPYKGGWLEHLDDLGTLYKRDLNMTLDGNQGRGGDEEPEVQPVSTSPSKPRIAAQPAVAPSAPAQPAPPAPPGRMPVSTGQSTDSARTGAGLGLRRPGGDKPPARTPMPSQQPPRPQVTYDPYGNAIDPRTGYPYPAQGQPQGGYPQPAYDPRFSQPQGGYPQPGYDPRFSQPQGGYPYPAQGQPQPGYDPRFSQPQGGYPQPAYDPRFSQPQQGSGYYDANGAYHPY